jgi:hypothetical protein
LATQCAREGDEHGLDVMSQLAPAQYKLAADQEPEPAAKKQYEQLFWHMKDAYPQDVDTAVREAQRMRIGLTLIEDNFGITTRQVQRAGFRMPPPRVSEEDRFALFRESLHATIRNTPALQAKYMRNPISQPSSTPKGAGGEWWSMAFSSAGVLPDGRHWWVITVVDSTETSMPKGAAEPRPHPWHNRLLYSDTAQSTAPPNPEETLQESVAAIFLAILLPAPGRGPPRRPERICLAYRMRYVYLALKKVGDKLGIEVSVVSQSVSLPAEAEQHTRLAAQRLNSPAGGDPDTGKGVAAKKKKKKKK